jgi:hypothetical protein
MASDEEQRHIVQAFRQLHDEGVDANAVFETVVVSLKGSVEAFMDAFPQGDLGQMHAWNAIALMVALDNCLHAFKCASGVAGILAVIPLDDESDDEASEGPITTPEELLQRALRKHQQGEG